jgi:hypothetical protein
MSEPRKAVKRFSILISKQLGQKHFASLLVIGNTGGYFWHQHVLAPWTPPQPNDDPQLGQIWSFGVGIGFLAVSQAVWDSGEEMLGVGEYSPQLRRCPVGRKGAADTSYSS